MEQRLLTRSEIKCIRAWAEFIERCDRRGGIEVPGGDRPRRARELQLVPLKVAAANQVAAPTKGTEARKKPTAGDSRTLAGGPGFYETPPWRRRGMVRGVT
jgi:hypothetical protein